MEKLLDSLTPTQRISGALVLFFTVILAKILSFFFSGYRSSLQPTLPPAIILVSGLPSARKTSVLSSIVTRFEHCARPFLQVSISDLTRHLTPEQTRRFFARPDKSASVNYSQQGAAALEGLHAAWKAQIEAGNNLLIDYTFTEPRQWENFRACLGRKLTCALVLVNVPVSTETSKQASQSDLHPLQTGSDCFSRFDLLSGQLVTVDSDTAASTAAQTVAVRLGAMGLL